MGLSVASVNVAGAGQWVPIEEFAGNLAAIVGTLRAQFERAEVLLITPPPIAERMRLEYVRASYGASALDRTDERAAAYADAAVSLARGLDGVHALDLHAAMTDAAAAAGGDAGRFLNDGLHLNVEGNAFLAGAVQRALCSILGVRSLEMVSVDYPPWDALAGEAVASGDWKAELTAHHARQKRSLVESNAACATTCGVWGRLARGDVELSREFVIGAGLAGVQAGIFFAVAWNRYWRSR